MALGIYISVPFCRTKCSYCNFASDVFSRAVFERYVDRVCADIENALGMAEEVGGKLEREVDSIYLGGGTPTVLTAEQLLRIFEAVRSQFDVQPDAEITVECAPGTLAPDVLDGLQCCGVNRVSLGVQSFVDREAAAVGRLHKRTTVLEDIERLRAAGISNINIDLIAGLPHQTAESWQLSLAESIATGAQHLSVYMLEVDDDSRLGRELMAGGTRYHAHFVPDDDAIADFYLAACEKLQAAGIAQYEISNFARDGFESRHNLKYWTRQPYLGFGVDAHSMLAVREGHDFTGCGKTPVNDQTGKGTTFSRAISPATSMSASAAGVRFRLNNHFFRTLFSRAVAKKETEPGFSPCGLEAVRFETAESLEQYVAGVPSQRTQVSPQAALEESFFLGLRLTRGVSLQDLCAQFGEQAIESFQGAIGELIDNGLMERAEDFVRLTSCGRMLSNDVFQRFILADEVARF